MVPWSALLKVWWSLWTMLFWVPVKNSFLGLKRDMAMLTWGTHNVILQHNDIFVHTDICTYIHYCLCIHTYCLFFRPLPFYYSLAKDAYNSYILNEVMFVILHLTYVPYIRTCIFTIQVLYVRAYVCLCICTYIHTYARTYKTWMVNIHVRIYGTYVKCKITNITSFKI